MPEDPSNEALVVTLGPERVVHTFVEDINLRLNPEPLESSVKAAEVGYEISVKATSLARDITLQVDRVDPGARVDHALVTLPAGSEWTFIVTTGTSVVDPLELISPAVLRTANDLRAVPTTPLPANAALTV